MRSGKLNNNTTPLGNETAYKNYYSKQLNHIHIKHSKMNMVDAEKK